jgi:disulfide bond formation protein DsbB
MRLSLRTAIVAYLLLGAAVIGFVLFSQYVRHYEPCELCLRERWPWYGVIGLGLAGAIFPSRAILALIGLALLVSAGLGLHHSGVEQHWWAGPTACTGGSGGARTIAELRAFLRAQQFVQCDQIAWKLFGLSMATYNFMLSLAAAVVAIALAARWRRTDHAS